MRRMHAYRHALDTGVGLDVAFACITPKSNFGKTSLLAQRLTCGHLWHAVHAWVWHSGATFELRSLSALSVMCRGLL